MTKEEYNKFIQLSTEIESLEDQAHSYFKPLINKYKFIQRIEEYKNFTGRHKGSIGSLYFSQDQVSWDWGCCGSSEPDDSLSIVDLFDQDWLEKLEKKYQEAQRKLNAFQQEEKKKEIADLEKRLKNLKA